MQTAQVGSERIGRAANTVASQASDPSAFLKGLGNDPDVPPTGCDFCRSIAENLQVNATAPVTEDLGTAIHETEASEIRRNNHQVGITV